jgi:hypothetical protein
VAKHGIIEVVIQKFFPRHLLEVSDKVLAAGIDVHSDLPGGIA